MIPFAEFPRVVAIGIGATVVMDLWLLLLKLLDVPTLNFAMVGRWVGNMPKGQWMHDPIAKATPVPGELALGWTVHYATGVAFAGLLAMVAGPQWMHAPSMAPAVLVGMATVMFPFFVMQPALGSGVMSLRTKAPVKNSIKSIANHTVFGLGMYVIASAISMWP